MRFYQLFGVARRLNTIYKGYKTQQPKQRNLVQRFFNDITLISKIPFYEFQQLRLPNQQNRLYSVWHLRETVVNSCKFVSQTDELVSIVGTPLAR